MGWLANYQWIRSLSERRFPPEDYAKKISTMQEKSTMEDLRALPDVIEVYHAKRLTEAKTGRSRVEIDLVVLKKDRIVLVEIKNFSGHISMVDDTLYQNGNSRNWSFAKLNEARKRLVDGFRETGIYLGTAEIHMALALLGSGYADESVNTGHNITQAAVARSIRELIEALDLPVSQEAEFNEEQISAIRSFFEMCGTWDEIVCGNGVVVEGDFRDDQDIDKWRVLYQNGQFINTRGRFFTLLLGPNFQAELTSWNGEASFQTVDVNSTISLQPPGSKKDVVSLRFDHISSFTFGYQTLPKWVEITLMQMTEVGSKDQTNKKIRASELRGGEEKEKLRVGQTISDATVAFHHDHGTIFQLTSKQRGMYFLTKMGHLEGEHRETFLRIGSNHDVRITKIKQNGNIEVEPLDE